MVDSRVKNSGLLKQSETFRKWFDGSKLADDQGNPVVLYHGARPHVDITEFELPNEFDGIYFTPDPLYAHGFTSELFADDTTEGAIYPVYLSIRKPYVVVADPEEEEWESFVYRGLNRLELIEQGYDGAMLIERSSGIIDQVQAYYPHQIKSASGNAGTFNPSVSDIRYARTDPRYLFAGPQAETSDLMLLDKARQMEQDKRSPAIIYDQTGWLRGVDGQWRYEITDHEANLKIGIPNTVEDDAFSRVYQEAEFRPDKNLIKAVYREGQPDYLAAWGKTKADAARNLTRAIIKREYDGYLSMQEVANQVVELGSILDHPRLFAAYPRLKDQNVFFDASLEHGERGSFNWGRGITVNPNMSSQDVLSTVLHEIQHAIQSAEGFARGGNPEQEFTGAVKSMLIDLDTEQRRQVNEWVAHNKHLITNHQSASDLLTYGLMYQSAQRLREHANRDKPSGVLRLIKSEMGWAYHDKVREIPDVRRTFDELERNWYNLPKRHKMAARNLFLREQCATAADLLGEVIPKDVYQQFRKDDRQLKSMIKALERESERAREKLLPLRKLEREESISKSLKDRHVYSTSFEIYQSLAGEIEARNTQARQNMTPEERRKTPPENTADVKRDDAIVVMRGEGGGSTVEIPYRMNSTLAQGYFRHPQSTAKALTSEEARYISSTLMTGWKGRPDIQVVDRISELPTALQKDIWKNRAARDMRAAFWKDTVYLVAPRLPNRLALEEVLLHEIIGHYGLRNFLRDDLEPTFERIYADMGHLPIAEEIKAAYFKAASFDSSDPEHRQLVAEELMAKLAETGEHSRLSEWDRYEAETRSGLRRMGFTLPLEKVDLLNLLHGAEQVVKHGGLSRPPEFDTRFRRVYHGSPHQFDAFSLNAVGTGEGAQAYGWGLYFAGQRRVAEWYQETLACDQSTPVFMIDGEPVDVINDIALRTAMYQVEEHGQVKAYAEVTEIANQLRSQGVEIEPITLETIEAIRSLEGKEVTIKTEEGHLYEAEIPDDSDLLDWDKPLCDQPSPIIQAIQNSSVLADTGNEEWPIASQLMDGNALYESIKQWFVTDDRPWAIIGKTPHDVRNVDQAASEYLNRLGIPGLRYLDGNNRRHGFGGHNYVIWDDKVVSIQSVNDELRQADQAPRYKRSGYIELKESDIFSDEVTQRIKRLAEQVIEAYATDDFARAESLDAELETLYDLLEHGMADMEENGLNQSFISIDGRHRQHAIYKDFSGAEDDGENGLLEDLAATYSDFIDPYNWMDEEHTIINGRAVIDDFRGSTANISDAEMLEIMKEAYENTGARLVEKRPEKRAFGKSIDSFLKERTTPSHLAQIAEHLKVADAYHEAITDPDQSGSTLKPAGP